MTKSFHKTRKMKKKIVDEDVEKWRGRRLWEEKKECNHYFLQACISTYTN